MGHEKDEVRKMSRLAIITARGGSKRIPKKNIRDFCGKPILAYSIEAALSSRLFDHVMVSTDDTEIAEIAKKYGAEGPFFRSEATSGDFATTNDVLAEVLAEYEKRDMHFESGCRRGMPGSPASCRPSRRAAWTARPSCYRRTARRRRSACRDISCD